MSFAFKDSILLTGTVYGHRFERENRTDRDVEIPPAMLITDETGAMWSIGTVYQLGRDGEFEWNVIRNDRDTGEFASKVVYRKGRVSIYGQGNRKIWNGRTFV